MKRLTFLVAGLVLSFVIGVSGAGAKPAAPTAPTASHANYTVAYVVTSIKYTYYQALWKAMKYEAAQLKIPASHLILYSSNDDPAQEINNVQAAISRHVNLIIDTSVDIPTGRRSAALAAKAKIPMIAADRAIPGAAVTSTVSSDNVAGGYTAGMYLGNALKGTGSVVMITGIPGVSNVVFRSEGFAKAMKKFPKIKVYSALNGKFDPGTAVSVMQDALSAHPDLRGVFVQADIMLAPICKLLQTRHVTNVITVGYDGDPLLYSCLRSGYATGSVGQAPAFMGEDTLALGIKAIQGQAVPKVVKSPVGVVTKKNLPCYLGWTHAPLAESAKLFKSGCTK
jgi:ABC-type sugar transport system substrate-binding protein